MNYRSLCALVLVGGLTACGIAPLAPPKEDTLAKQMVPAEGKAVIYLFRNSPPSAGWTIPVTLDGNAMGVTGAQTYFRWEVSPGEHVIISKTNDWSGLVVDAESGHTYYIWQDIGIGLFVPTSRLLLVDRDTAEINLRDCYLLRTKS